MTECPTCGPLAWRGGTHAEWCPDIRAFLAEMDEDLGRCSHGHVHCTRVHS